MLDRKCAEVKNEVVNVYATGIKPREKNPLKFRMVVGTNLTNERDLNAIKVTFFAYRRNFGGDLCENICRLTFINKQNQPRR